MPCFFTLANFFCPAVSFIDGWVKTGLYMYVCMYILYAFHFSICFTTYPISRGFHDGWHRKCFPKCDTFNSVEKSKRKGWKVEWGSKEKWTSWRLKEQEQNPDSKLRKWELNGKGHFDHKNLHKVALIVFVAIAESHRCKKRGRTVHDLIGLIWTFWTQLPNTLRTGCYFFRIHIVFRFVL